MRSNEIKSGEKKKGEKKEKEKTATTETLLLRWTRLALLLNQSVYL